MDEISEIKEKSLIGLTIDGKKITKKTSSEHWAGDFGCSHNKLTSLVGAPSSVGGGFYCYNNKLTSLEGAPSSVGGHFYCYNNKLTSLVGAPSSVGGDFNCSNNNLTSLKGIEKILKKMDGIFYAYGNPLKSHIIGLLLVPGCKRVEIDNKQVAVILNRHLQSPFGNKRVIDCQSELLDAGLDDFAKL
jgi:hypothetical protein